MAVGSRHQINVVCKAQVAQMEVRERELLIYTKSSAYTILSTQSSTTRCLHKGEEKKSPLTARIRDGAKEETKREAGDNSGGASELSDNRDTRASEPVPEKHSSHGRQPLATVDHSPQMTTPVGYINSTHVRCRNTSRHNSPVRWRTRFAKTVTTVNVRHHTPPGISQYLARYERC